MLWKHGRNSVYGNTNSNHGTSVRNAPCKNMGSMILRTPISPYSSSVRKANVSRWDRPPGNDGRKKQGTTVAKTMFRLERTEHGNWQHRDGGRGKASLLSIVRNYNVRASAKKNTPKVSHWRPFGNTRHARPNGKGRIDGYADGPRIKRNGITETPI